MLHDIGDHQPQTIARRWDWPMLLAG